MTENIKLTKWAQYHKYNITLDVDDADSDRILRLEKCHDGSINFVEMCDQYFAVNMSKDDAILTLKEAIAWIKGLGDG